jgi:hypothetical protein
MDIYRSAGGVFLDAAAFSLGDICTLAVGDSGAAKSTLSAAAIAAGDKGVVQRLRDARAGPRRCPGAECSSQST